MLLLVPKMGEILGFLKSKPTKATLLLSKEKLMAKLTDINVLPSVGIEEVTKIDFLSVSVPKNAKLERTFLICSAMSVRVLGPIITLLSFLLNITSPINGGILAPSKSVLLIILSLSNILKYTKAKPETKPMSKPLSKIVIFCGLIGDKPDFPDSIIWLSNTAEAKVISVSSRLFNK